MHRLGSCGAQDYLPPAGDEGCRVPPTGVGLGGGRAPTR
jgi:hypothetical protein